MFVVVGVESYRGGVLSDVSLDKLVGRTPWLLEGTLDSAHCESYRQDDHCEWLVLTVSGGYSIFGSDIANCARHSNPIIDINSRVKA